MLSMTRLRARTAVVALALAAGACGGGESPTLPHRPLPVDPPGKKPDPTVSRCLEPLRSVSFDCGPGEGEPSPAVVGRDAVDHP